MGITTREALMRAWVDGWSRGVDGLTTDEAKSAIADKLMLELVGPVDAHYTSATLTAEIASLREGIRKLKAMVEVRSIAAASLMALLAGFLGSEWSADYLDEFAHKARTLIQQIKGTP